MGLRLDRRGFLVLGAALVAAPGCDASPGADGPSGARPTRPQPPYPTSTGGSSATPPPSSTGPGRLPAVTQWAPNRSDVLPAVKAQAARVAEALGSWAAGDEGRAAAALRLRALGQDEALAGHARALLGPAREAALQVVDAQYGGIVPGSTSVLVVCRQWLGTAGGAVRPGGTTVDVRLEAARPHWRVTELHPAEPGPPSSPVSSLAREVLRADRIELPPAARADVSSGQVHDTVLMALLRLSTSYRIGVSVVRSGHPLHVFGTTRLSDHPQGRAFDTFRIDGRLVVDKATPRGLVTGYMRAVVEAGSYNVGGPDIPPGGGSAFFSDATHHDHVHAGFSA